MNQDKERRINLSTTHIVKLVLPHTTNNYNTLFGGTALQWMDEAGGICALRFARKQVVTVSLDQTDFKKPIPAGTIVELIAKVIEVGRTSIKVQVDVFVEQRYSDEREKAITGVLTFVAINEKGKPTAILDT